MEIETVTLDESIEHPLDAVLAQVDRTKNGPVMIVGLERSNPSAAKERPILYALNMSRPDWPKEIPRPLVLWIPEYLLGLMGREAPDFLDWRSDTLFFPDPATGGLLPLKSEVWLSGQRESKSEEQRRARIRELESRLAVSPDADDPVVMAARSGWYEELGNLLFQAGDLNAARTCYLASLEVERKLGREEGIADALGNLGLISYAAGEAGDAEKALFEVLGIHRKLGKRYGEATGLANLASVALESNRIDDAEAYARQAREVARDAGLQHLMPFLSNIDFGVAVARRDPAAQSLGREALAEASRADLLPVRAQVLHNLGVLFSREGDLDRAEQAYKEALEISRVLGMRAESAKSLLDIGALYALREDVGAAIEVLTEAEQLSLETGDRVTSQRARDLLATLDSCPPKTSSIPQ